MTNEHFWKFWHHNHQYIAYYCINCNIKGFFDANGKLYYYLNDINPGLNAININCNEWIIKNIIE